MHKDSDERKHYLSITIADAFACAYRDYGATDCVTLSLLEAYKESRRKLPKKSGKRYGSREAYEAVMGS